MRLAFRVGFGVMAMTCVLGLARSASAATGSCMSLDGACELSNDDGSFLTCECSDGIGVAGDYGDEWEGLSDDELEALCPRLLAGICSGGPPPPPGVPCETEEGSCVVSGAPPAFDCTCNDGSGGGGVGDDDWAGLSDDELFDVCVEVALETCGGVATSESSTTEDPSGTSASESDSGTDETGDDTTTTSDDTGTTDASATDPSATDTDPSASASATVTDTATATDTATDTDPTAGDSSGDESTDASATDASATDATATDPSATASATNGDDSSGTDSTAGSSDDGGGCGCRTGGDPRSAFALALLVGIAVRRRRR